MLNRRPAGQSDGSEDLARDHLQPTGRFPAAVAGALTTSP